jgi:hypothetical protein
MGTPDGKPSEPLPMDKSSAYEPRRLVDDEQTLAELAGLGGAQGSLSEAAAAMGVPPGRLERFMARHSRARIAFDKAAARARLDLRAAQFALARTNATMAAFVAKHYLGPAERLELDQSEQAQVAGAADRVRRKLDALIAHRQVEDDPGLGGDL